MKRTLILLLLCMSVFWLEAYPLRILGIGNSFTRDLMDQVPQLLEEDTAYVELAYLCKNSATLDDHLTNLETNQAEYIYYHYNNQSQQWDTLTTNIRSIIEQQSWDYIVLHQASYYSGVFPTVKHSLPQLTNRLLACQPQAQLVWQLTWAYAKEASFNEFSIYDYSQEQMLYKTVDVTEHVIKDSLQYHISQFIPSGIVIQRLRQTSLANTSSDLCYDGRHIDQTIGRYALACTFYQTLLAEPLQRSVLEHSWYNETDKQHSATDYATIRQHVYDICTHLNEIWEEYRTDHIYRADYYNMMGRRIYHLEHGQYLLEHDFYESGRQHGHLILLTE